MTMDSAEKVFLNNTEIILLYTCIPLSICKTLDENLNENKNENKVFNFDFFLNKSFGVQLH